MKRYWSRIVVTAFVFGLIAQFLTAYFFEIEAGNEIWIEIPFFLAITVSVWIVEARR